jgi:hypothetical protein
MTRSSGSEERTPGDAHPAASDNARLESLMAEVPPSTPGWSAPPSRTPVLAQWSGVAAFAIGLAVVLDMALVHQGQRSIVAGGILGVALLAGVGLAIAAIVGGIQVRSKRDNDAAARTRAAIAICLAAISLVLMTLAGLELYAIGLDAF